MDKHINLVKLCVGAETLKDLIDWQTSPRAKGHDGFPRHVTRMWPRRENELLAVGALYWVIKGTILARQKILRLDEVNGTDGISRCALVLDPKIHRTEAAPKRPFQGWRYLTPAQTPRDLPASQATEVDALPPRLLRDLAEIGVR